MNEQEKLTYKADNKLFCGLYDIFRYSRSGTLGNSTALYAISKLPQFNLAIGFSQNHPELKLSITSVNREAYKMILH